MASVKKPSHVVLERPSGPAEVIGVTGSMKGITWDDTLPSKFDPQLRRVSGDIVRVTLLYRDGSWATFNVVECAKPLHGALWSGLGPRFTKTARLPQAPADDPTYAPCLTFSAVAPDVCFPVDDTMWCPAGTNCVKQRG